MTTRAWVGWTLAGAGVVLGALAALGGEPVGGAVLGLFLVAVGGVLRWIGRAGDARAVSRRKRAVGIVLVAGFGTAFAALGLAMRAEGDEEATFVLWCGLVGVVIALVWWVATRDSGLPDTREGLIELGDGRPESGTYVTMPRSKRIAMAAGVVIMGVTFVALAPTTIADGDLRGWLLGVCGVIVLAFAPFVVLTAVRPAHLAVSDSGLTVRLNRSHYTLPWDAVDHAAVFEFETYHRGFKQTHRQLGIAADLDRAVGTVRGRRLGGWGWALTFPQTTFDLHIEDVAELLNEARSDAERRP